MKPKIYKSFSHIKCWWIVKLPTGHKDYHETWESAIAFVNKWYFNLAKYASRTV